jgi:hypothetical protein
MIKIEITKASKSSNGIDLMTPICNNATEAFGKNLKQKVSNFKCKDHPNSSGTIRIISTPNKSSLFEIRKSNFCCLDFENSIQIQIK